MAVTWASSRSSRAYDLACPPSTFHSSSCSPLLIQMAALMGKTDSTLRGMCKTNGWPIVSDINPQILARLKENGAVLKNAKAVALIQMADVVKLSEINKVTWEAMKWHYSNSKAPPPRSSFNLLFPLPAQMPTQPILARPRPPPGIPDLQEEEQGEEGEEGGGWGDAAATALMLWGGGGWRHAGVQPMRSASPMNSQQQQHGQPVVADPPWRGKEGAGATSRAARGAVWAHVGGRRLDTRPASIPPPHRMVTAKRSREASPPPRHTTGTLLRRMPPGAAPMEAPVMAPAPMVFPTAPPVVNLSTLEASRPYALKDPSARLNREIAQYEEWSGAPINTERSLRYIKAAQTTSLAKTQAMVMAYAGVVHSHFAIRREDITLGIYACPTYLARFVGFLQVKKGHGVIRVWPANVPHPHHPLPSILYSIPSTTPSIPSSTTPSSHPHHPHIHSPLPPSPHYFLHHAILTSTPSPHPPPSSSHPHHPLIHLPHPHIHTIHHTHD